MRTERVERALYFDISQGDVSMTQTTGVQADPQTYSAGTQSSTTRMDDSETQTRPPLNRSNTKGTQATEDKSEEIEKSKCAGELEKLTLIDQQAKNIEQVRQQIRAEAETAHERKIQ